MKQRENWLLLVGVLVASPLVLAAATEGVPTVDVNRVINESYGFLKEREPEMTESEYALYERVVPMISQQPDFAFKLLETMLADDQPESPAFNFVLASAYFGRQRYAAAEARYRAALEKYPTFLRAWDDLGILYFATARYADAIPCFTRALALGSRESRVYGLLGFSLKMVGNLLPAEMAYMQAVSLDPENADWMQGLVSIFLETKQFGRAEAVVRQLIRAQPQDAKHWLVLADLLLTLQRPLEAVAVLDTVAALNVGGPEGLTLLGDVCVGQHMFAEAVSAYRRAMADSPEAGLERLVKYARALIAADDLDHATRLLELIASEPVAASAVPVMLAKAELLTARGDSIAAIAVLDQVMGIEPMNGEALMILGRIRKSAGDLSRAQLAFESAYQVPEYTYEAGIELANLATKAREYRRAADYVRAALSRRKSTELQEYLATIEALIK